MAVVSAPFQVATSDLILQVRERLDIVGSQNPPDSAILNMLNQAVKRYYDLIVEAYGNDYYFNQTTITTVNNQQYYSLPLDFYKIRFCDLIVGAAGNQKVPMLPFPEELRDSYGFGSPMFIQSGQQIQVTYTPRAPTLLQYAQLQVLTADGVDYLTLTAQQPGLTGTKTQIVIATGGPAGTATASASGLVVTITIGTGATANQVIAAIQSNAGAFSLVSASASQPADLMVQSVLAATNLGGNVQYDFVNGWERLVIADVCAQVAARLDLDPTPFLQEKAELKAEIGQIAQTRDSGHAMEVKDKDIEDFGWPFAPSAFRSYRYRMAGSQLWLVAVVPGFPII